MPITDDQLKVVAKAMRRFQRQDTSPWDSPDAFLRLKYRVPVEYSRELKFKMRGKGVGPGFFDFLGPTYHCFEVLREESGSMVLDLSNYYLLESIVDAEEDGELPEGVASLPQLIDDLHDMIDENGGDSGRWLALRDFQGNVSDEEEWEEFERNYGNHPTPSIPWLGWESPELWWDQGERTPDEKWAESQDVRLTWWFDETDRKIAESAGLRSGITSRCFRVPWEGEQLSVKGFELYNIRHKGSMARDGAVSFEGFEYGTPVGPGEGIELVLERKRSSQTLSTDFSDIVAILKRVADEL